MRRLYVARTAQAMAERRGGVCAEPPLPGTGATRGQEAARQERVRGGADDAPPPERVPEAHQQQAPSERAHAVGGDEPGLRVRVGIFRELPRALLRERDVAGSDAVPGEEAPDGEEPEQVPLHRGRRERDRHADDATTRISRVSLGRSSPPCGKNGKHFSIQNGSAPRFESSRSGVQNGGLMTQGSRRAIRTKNPTREP